MMRLIARLDALAERLGLFPAGSPRPRHLRWLPLAALGLATAGLVRQVATPAAELFEGGMLAVFGFALSAVCMYVGPLRNPTAEEPLDERERLVRMRATLAGAGSVAMIAVAASLLFSVGGWFGIWTPRTGDDWQVVCFFLLAVFNSVPSLHASWSTRPLDEEE